MCAWLLFFGLCLGLCLVAPSRLLGRSVAQASDQEEQEQLKPIKILRASKELRLQHLLSDVDRFLAQQQRPNQSDSQHGLHVGPYCALRGPGCFCERDQGGRRWRYQLVAGALEQCSGIRSAGLGPLLSWAEQCLMQRGACAAGRAACHVVPAASFMKPAP